MADIIHDPIPTPKKNPSGEPKGNIFTRIFKKGQPVRESSIIDTIVAQADQKKEEVKAVKQEQKKHEQDLSLGFLFWSRLFFRFTILFVVITAGFFYIQNIDTENRVLGLLGDKENYASRLHSAAQQYETKQKELNDLKKEIDLYRKGYNNEYEAVLQRIVDGRIDWSEIIKKIDEVTEVVYEKNSLAQYIKYDSYSFDADQNQIRVSGTLTDPLGKNLAKLIELEEAFRANFDNVSPINTVSKTLDSQTGKYTSNFQISFSLRPKQPVNS